MGGKPSKASLSGAQAIKKGGEVIHEVGGTIMGANRNKSVLNQYNQSWDVPNLFVNDGGAFASNADKNPTLTIMALAWRASDFILEEMRKGNL
jgi:choline dehydrogenase-like flavoprotein